MAVDTRVVAGVAVRPFPAHVLLRGAAVARSTVLFWFIFEKMGVHPALGYMGSSPPKFRCDHRGSIPRYPKKAGRLPTYRSLTSN